MADDVVAVSAHHAMTGLYLSPDLSFFGSYFSEMLYDLVQTVIHSRQPLSSSYAKFADSVHDRYAVWAESNEDQDTPNFLMAAYGLISTGYFIRRGLLAMTTVACNICLETMGRPEYGDYARIIPPELRHMRISSPDDIGPETFQMIIVTEPWVTWSERLRSQYNRMLRSLTAVDFKLGDALRVGLADTQPLVMKGRKPLHEQSEVRRAIKRAVKLHHRILHNDDVVRFINGKTVKIDGRLYSYYLRKSHSLLDGMTSHRKNRMAPCHLDVYNKQDKLLAGACLYFYDTSILDYLLNVRLYVSNETTEMDMLHAMHMTSTTRAFYADPILPTLKGIGDPATAPLHMVSNLDQYQFDTVCEERIYTAYSQDHYDCANSAFDEFVGLPSSYLNLVFDLSQFNMRIIVADNEELFMELNKITPELVT